MEIAPLFAFIAIIVGLVVFFVFLLAPLKLYSIDKTLRAILEELKIARISRPGGPL
jgi:hypothetical protein